jgi:hypothetical protein
MKEADGQTEGGNAPAGWAIDPAFSRNRSHRLLTGEVFTPVASRWRWIAGPGMSRQ